MNNKFIETSHAENLSELDIVCIESACIRLIHQYCVSADRHDLQMLLGVFSIDAQWTRPNGELIGHKAIGDYFSQRPKDELTCHAASNALISVHSGKRAHGTSLVAVYRHKGDAGQIALLHPSSLVEYIDEFVCDHDSRWRIKKRSSRTILKTVDNKAGGPN